jgi:hypothetical protein
MRGRYWSAKIDDILVNTNSKIDGNFLKYKKIGKDTGALLSDVEKMRTVLEF